MPLNMDYYWISLIWTILVILNTCRAGGKFSIVRFHVVVKPSSPKLFPNLFSEGEEVPPDYQYRRTYKLKFTTSLSLWVSFFPLIPKLVPTINV